MNWLKRLWNKITGKNVDNSGDISTPMPQPIEDIEKPKSEEYWAKEWSECEIDPNRLQEVLKICGQGIANKDKYIQVMNATGLPWYGVFAFHYREASLNFNTYLHNGDPLGIPTIHVPRGIYFAKGQWIEAAIHAIKLDNLNKIYNSIPQVLAAAERFNGIGYRKKIGDSGRVELSPYVWAGTNKHDETSKYTGDGKYDANAKEKQLGVAAIIKGFQILGQI